MLTPIGFSRRFSDLAADAPDHVAVIFLPAAGGEEVWTRRQLDQWMNRLAHWLAARGVGPGSWVVIGLPNGPLHLVLALAAWRLGATVLPLNARMPAAEAAKILNLLDPAIIVADWALDHPRLVPSSATAAIGALNLPPVPDRIPHPGKAVGSGGSTGTPKIIVDLAPWAARPGEIVERIGRHVGVRTGQIQLLAGPLYHNAPFSWAHYGLFEGHRLVLMERFDPGRALDAIATYHAEWVALVPTMMLRMLREQRATPRNLSSLEGVYHTAAACPPWVKEGWIELVGAKRVFEAYGSTEGIGATIIRGDEWLAHRGSVGRPLNCRIEIRDPEGRPLPVGGVGEVYFQSGSIEPTFRYVGTTAPAPADRFGTVGDLGWLDSAGYLYLADRRTDLIITGGVNVYPAEVEIALSEHPAIEGGRYGVRSNVVSPSARTRMTLDTAASAGVVAAPADPGAFDRWDPANVSPVVCWLAQADCPATSQIFHLMGGSLFVMQVPAVAHRLESAGRWSLEALDEALAGKLAKPLPVEWFFEGAGA